VPLGLTHTGEWGLTRAMETREPSEPEQPAPRRRQLVVRRPGSGTPGDPTGLYRPSRTWALLARFSFANLITALVAACIFAGLAGAVVLKEKAKYESSSVVELHQAKVFTDSGPGPVTKLNALRARYASLAETQAVLAPVGTKVGLPPGQVGRAVTVVIGAPSLLMRPTARTTSPKLSQQLADAMADELTAYAQKEQTDDKIAPGDQVQLRVVQRALPGVKVSPDSSRALAAAAIVGVLVLAGVYTLLQLVIGRTRKS
jgi:capsular polysaccharide biosynthesis protein